MTEQDVNTLDKQIPMKPILVNGYPTEFYVCPSCLSTFIQRCGKHMKYCNNCGQRIDWSDNDDC